MVKDPFSVSEEYFLTNFVDHVDIVGVMDVKNGAFGWDSKKSHEHECADQSCPLIPLLGEVDDCPVAH